MTQFLLHILPTSENKKIFCKWEDQLFFFFLVVFILTAAFSCTNLNSRLQGKRGFLQSITTCNNLTIQQQPQEHPLLIQPGNMTASELTRFQNAIISSYSSEILWFWRCSICLQGILEFIVTEPLKTKRKNLQNSWILQLKINLVWLISELITEANSGLLWSLEDQRNAWVLAVPTLTTRTNVRLFLPFMDKKSLLKRQARNRLVAK